jgi:hypothetical protein
MDGNGARELARLLEERHGQCPPAATRRALLNADAAPIFHWLGIEPSPTVAPRRPAEDVDASLGSSA